ncbi:glycosyltransferase family 4 protein [Sphingomonas sp.]|jgi:glycosyltransferase involved in cell wall biosynthesis|uniref:glycosyltransferase family 4 protein n=1 Tax=Sphingomonas sp. TaxID=28214 RepID=UPI002D7FA9E6|nr:glycosyltransferase family 4 protein [Sphingomonas sp.]HEU0044543.1 glycosyltransferase family 4 protein [Sphingomonas sp.]
MRRLVLLSVNNSWNILNFRAGMVRRLQDAGYDVSVVSPADAHAPELAALGVVHIPAAIDSKGLSPIGDLRLLVRYWRVLRQERPAALLTWTIKPNIYGSIAAHLLGIPVINNVSGLGTAFIHKGLLTRLVSALYVLAFSRSARVFFQNPEDLRTFVDGRLVAERRAGLLPGSGIDTDWFSPSPASEFDPQPARPFVFLLVARLLRDKGLVEYADAARLMRGAWPDVRFQLLGSLDAANRTAIGRAELAAWIEEGLIDYLGEVADVRPHVHAADCIVLPSYREGMPRSLLEGAAMGKPLIATRVPGCVEIARDGRNALLCEPRDARSLADAMTRMIELPQAERDALGAEGRRIAVAEFAERLVTDRYLKVVDALSIAPR